MKNTEPVKALSSFANNEQLIYEGEFSKALLRGINVAEINFATHGFTQDENDEALRVTCEAKSKGFFSNLFGLDFRFALESFIDPKSLVVRRTLKIDQQGKRHRTSEAVFNRNERRVVWTERDPNDAARPPRIVEAELRNNTHDLVSAIYFLRAQQLTPGARFELNISDSGHVYQVPVHVAGTKRIDTVLGKVEVVRVDVDVFGKDRLVDTTGKMSLLFTNDLRRIPVQAQINNPFGKLTIKLRRYDAGK